jgi:hypothetical protein
MLRKVSIFILCIFFVFVFTGCEDGVGKLKNENHNLRVNLSECQQRITSFSQAMELATSGDYANAAEIYNGVRSSEVDKQKEIISNYTKNILTIILIGSLAIMAVLLFIAAFAVDSFLEGFVRFIAIIAAFILYFGSKFTGLSIPSLMLSAITTSNPIYFISVGALIPSLVGVTASWYVLKKLKKNESFAYRIAIFIGVFLITIFSDVLLAAFGTNISGSKELVPNISFVLGVSLYVVFRYETKKSNNN